MCYITDIIQLELLSLSFLDNPNGKFTTPAAVFSHIPSYSSMCTYYIQCNLHTISIQIFTYLDLHFTVIVIISPCHRIAAAAVGLNYTQHVGQQHQASKCVPA